MQVHAIAKVVPPLSEEDQLALMESIEAKGPLVPVYTRQGQIIANQHIAEACAELGVLPVVHQWQGDGSLAEFVANLIVQHRHLNQVERLQVAYKLLPFLEEEARERQREAGRRHGRGQAKLRANRPQAIGRNHQRASDNAAKLLKVSGRQLRRFARVQEQAPQLLPLISAGKVSVSAAEAVARLAGEERASVIEEALKEGRLLKTTNQNGSSNTSTGRTRESVSTSGKAERGNALHEGLLLVDRLDRLLAEAVLGQAELQQLQEAIEVLQRRMHERASTTTSEV